MFELNAGKTLDFHYAFWLLVKKKVSTDPILDSQRDHFLVIVNIADNGSKLVCLNLERHLQVNIQEYTINDQPKQRGLGGSRQIHIMISMRRFITSLLLSWNLNST